VFGALVVETCLVAGPILQVSYFAPPGVTCGSTLSSGIDSETLNIGPCSGDGYDTMRGLPYVTATADSFQVSVDGTPGLMCPDPDFCSVSIGASAEFEGALEALGGLGPAFIEFDVSSFGANSFVGDFAIPSLGVDQSFGGFGEEVQVIIPVTFGELIPYSLSVQHEFFPWGEPDVMLAGLTIYNLQVVDASGNVIAGTQAIDPPPGDPTPEPATAVFPVTALGLLILCRQGRQALRRLGSIHAQQSAPAPYSPAIR
jgi:hypothetical protein